MRLFIITKKDWDFQLLLKVTNRSEFGDCYLCITSYLSAVLKQSEWLSNRFLEAVYSHTASLRMDGWMDRV